MTYRIIIGRNRYFLLVAFILTGFTFYFGIRQEAVQKWNMRLLKREQSVLPTGFLVDTPGCRIPEMDPYDLSIRKYVKSSDKDYPVCDEILPLVESNQTSIWIVAEVLTSYNVSDSSELECCYSEFRRSTRITKNKILDNTMLVFVDCIPFNNSANIPFEFIKVVCKVNGSLMYEDFHAFIVPKNKNSSESTKENLEDSPRESDVSVLIIGADSLSRLNFHRVMPKTKNFIKNLGAIEFFGYNKVQDNTFPNLVPLLSGYSYEEITFCWPNRTAYFDDCPWIWKNFSSKNYMTAFGEDSSWMGAFNFNKLGFLQPPTDYYARPFMYLSEITIGHHKVLNTEFCIGHRYAPKVLFDYAYKFSVNMTLSNKKFWGFFWESSLTHDFLNAPSQIDDIFYNFFEKLHNNNVMNNTVVFFLSDHGMRWGQIRNTYQGRMEEHLPCLFILFPGWFKERYSVAMKNVQRNTHLLTTHFDVHETMKDLLDLNALNPQNLKARETEVPLKRGFSLFVPGSVHRTCESAGIKPTWCTCHRKKDVLTTDTLVRKAAKVTVDHLNSMLENYPKCARLQIQKIISARIESDEKEFGPNIPNQFFTDYVITLITVPGLAKFESVVRYSPDTSKMTVSSDVSRINLYGSQSSCITDYRLKLYCYCI